MPEIKDRRHPLVPAEIDLRNLQWMPLDVVKIVDSDLVANGGADGVRAALILWCKSWHQVPASSLPNDERRLAQWCGVSSKRWESIREKALHGFILCADDRYYHPIIAAKAMESWELKRKQSERAKGRYKSPQLDLGVGSRGSTAAEPHASHIGIVFVLPDWVPVEAWDGYVEMRKRAGKPLTERAMDLAVKDLLAYKNIGNDPAAVLDQSTKRGWMGLFEIKSTAIGGGRNGGTLADRNADVARRIAGGGGS